MLTVLLIGGCVIFDVSEGCMGGCRSLLFVFRRGVNQVLYIRRGLLGVHLLFCVCFENFRRGAGVCAEH